MLFRDRADSAARLVGGRLASQTGNAERARIDISGKAIAPDATVSSSTSQGTPHDSSEVISVFSVDVEDYFHDEAFRDLMAPSDWAPHRRNARLPRAEAITGTSEGAAMRARAL